MMVKRLIDLLQKAIIKNKEMIALNKNNNDWNNVYKKQVEKENRNYKKIITALSDSKSKNFITDLEIIDKLLEINNVSEENRNDIYQFILKYNKKVYDYKIGNCSIKDLELLGENDISKLKKLFTKYGYDFDKLPSKIQEVIVDKASINNIKEVFEALLNNNYKLNIEKDAYLLMSLLIGSNKSTISKISKLAFSKGLTSDEVLTIGGILIEQSKNKVRSNKLYERFNIENVIDDGPRVVGSEEDFEKNVKELGKWGISVRYIYDRCKYVLICSNEVLSHNLSLFQDYGFSLKTKNNKLCFSTLSALLKYNTVEIIDRFIEVHPFGLEYLKNNLSILRQVSSLEDLVFYKLYYSNKNFGSEAAFIKIVNNNLSQLALQGKVSGLSSTYYNAYANINEDSKYIITNIFIPTYSRDYYSLIKNKISNDISATIFDNKYIQCVNRYSDYKEPLLYDFDGIRISKLKVLRIFDTLLKVGVEANDESFLYALLYNTMISRDDFVKISKMVKLEG